MLTTLPRRTAATALAVVVTSAAAVCAPTVGPVDTMPTAAAAAPARATEPAAFGTVTAKPGPRPGQVRFSWRHNGKHVTSFRLETALTQFSADGRGLPRRGRHFTTFTISAEKRSFVLTRALADRAGAALGSGRHLYWRFYAVNTKGTGTAVRAYPKLRAVLPRGRAAAHRGPSLRVATFNVRTAKARGDKRRWLQRRADVAATIVGTAPAVVAIQELGPGRADGRAGSTVGTVRQTDSLLRSLARRGGKRYKLVRTTPYARPGAPTGTQGARLLYDSKRLTLLSVCSQTTRGRSWSSSCSLALPLLGGDSEKLRRRAAYAKFRDRRTGEQFYAVSVHLDERHSSRRSREVTLDRLRGRQIRRVVAEIDKRNTRDLPVVVAGDLNSWQNNRAGQRAHDALVNRGFFDTASARSTVRLRYATVNKFRRVQPASALGFGARLDGIFVSRAPGAARFVNHTRKIDSARPSDHNLLYTDITL